ncbi:MAG: hypothetical protein AB7S61_11805, partial [Methanoregulaceae archaeon]
MKTLCFYISDYGLGHATRAIALIRALVSADDDLSVIAKTSGPGVILRRSVCHPRVETVDCRNESDIVLEPGRSVVDRARTLEGFLAWTNGWDEWVARETEFCTARQVDLVLSDITPQAFEVADRSGVPGVAVSNFTWETIYHHLFPDRAEEVDLLRAAYNKATHACILPFEIEMDVFSRSERVGLVTRTATVPREEMRRRAGVGEDEFLVFVGRGAGLEGLPRDAGTRRGGGRGPEWGLPVDRTVSSARGTDAVRLLVPTGVSHPGALSIPATETESQHWIGMCDCVVAKCGYSTVSEAMRARLPLLVWKRDGFVEDVAIAGTIERLGI